MASEFRLRRGEAGDATSLARLAAATFPLACPESIPPTDIAEHIARELTPDRFTADLGNPAVEIHLAEAAALVGYLMVVPAAECPAPLPGSAPGELRRIYVDPDWHGRGVGDALLDLALRRIAAGAGDWIWLGTNRANARAIAFYRRHGFRPVGTRTFRVGGRLADDVVLARSLSGVSTAAPAAPAELTARPGASGPASPPGRRS